MNVEINIYISLHIATDTLHVMLKPITKVELDQLATKTSSDPSPSASFPKHIVRPDYIGKAAVPEWPDYIELKDQEQVEGLTKACQLARQVLLLAGRCLKVGHVHASLHLWSGI